MIGRRLVIIAVMLYAASWFGASIARAQDTEWLEPGGRYSLAFTELGWSATPDLAHAPNVLAFVRNDSPQDDRMRICFVRDEVAPNSNGITQSVANSLLARWTEQRLSQVVGVPVRNMVHATKDGIALIDYRSEREGLDILARFFLLAGDAGAELITISCGFPSPLTDEEIASINAVFNTLHIRSISE